MNLKKTVSFTTFFILCSILTPSSSVAQATELSEATVHHSQNFNTVLKQQLGKMGWQLGLFYGKNGQLPAGQIPLFDYKLPSLEVSQSKVEADKMTVSELEPLHTGYAEFHNTSGEEQSYQSQEYKKVFETSATATTTHVISNAVEASGKIGLPIVADGTIKVTVKYDFSNSRAQTEKSSDTYVMKSQKVTVPPGKKYAIEVQLMTGKTTGNLLLTSNVTGFVPYSQLLEGDKVFPLKVSETVSEYQKNINNLPSYNFLKNWHYEPEMGDAARAQLGVADLTVNYGSHMTVKTFDITDGKKEFVKSEDVEIAKLPHS